MDRVLFVLVCLAAAGAGIVGGIFYGFSSFVMRALGGLPPEQGIAAMNSINKVVVTPSFMLVFVGSALLSAVLAAGSSLWWPQASGKLVLAAALLYLVGCFGSTMLMNQPMNLKLAAMDAAQARLYWPKYVETWTAWNHLRTAVALLAAGLFVAALVAR